MINRYRNEIEQNVYLAFMAPLKPQRIEITTTQLILHVNSNQQYETSSVSL